MKERKPLDINNNDFIRITIIVFGSVISATILALTILAMAQLEKKNLALASNYLFGVFIALGFSRLVTFIKERNKVSFYRFLILLVADIALGVVIFYGKHNPYLYSLSGGLYCLTIIVSRVFKIIQNHSVRNIVFSSIVAAFALLLGIGLFIPTSQDVTYSIVLIVCILIALSAFIEVFSNATSQLRVKVLFKIILKTYALEILLGLLTMMVAASLGFMFSEPSITNFADAMWYSFAVVTTIGFGDFTAVTPLGRVLTVILGIYGLLVVAVLTSIIVNFYNETAGKQDAKGIQEIKEEQEKEKEKHKKNK